MRPLNQYTLAEWLVAKPPVELVKRLRNIALDRYFRLLPGPGLDNWLGEHVGLQGQTVAFTIAFNTPWAIDLLTRTAARNLPGTTLVVADNSNRRDARDAIAGICRGRGVAYLGLPANPEGNPTRSHGIAMNWIYYNVVRRLRPRVFAFLDHDFFPLARMELAPTVASQPFYGRSNLLDSPHGWSLWAGFCVYDFAAVQGYALDFNNDQSINLSSGGCNWWALYRYFDRAGFSFADVREELLTDPLDRTRRPVLMIDNAAHVTAASYGNDSPCEFFERIVGRCEAGATLDELRAP